jgi:hypothetical protein
MEQSKINSGRFQVSAPADVTWKTEKGDISISEMDTDHIQKAYYYAEHKYLTFFNQYITAMQKAELFTEKIAEFEREMVKRGKQLHSIAERDSSKYQLLRNERTYRFKKLQKELI